MNTSNIEIKSILVMPPQENTVTINYETENNGTLVQEWLFTEQPDGILLDILGDTAEIGEVGILNQILSREASLAKGPELFAKFEEVGTEGLRSFFEGIFNKYFAKTPKKQLRKKDGFFATRRKAREIIINTLLNDTWVGKLEITEKPINAQKILPGLAMASGTGTVQDAIAIANNRRQVLALYCDFFIRYFDRAHAVYSTMGRDTSVVTAAKEIAKIDVASFASKELTSLRLDIGNSMIAYWDKDLCNIKFEKYTPAAIRTVPPVSPEEMKQCGEALLTFLDTDEMIVRETSTQIDRIIDLHFYDQEEGEEPVNLNAADAVLAEFYEGGEYDIFRILEIIDPLSGYHELSRWIDASLL